MLRCPHCRSHNVLEFESEEEYRQTHTLSTTLIAALLLLAAAAALLLFFFLAFPLPLLPVMVLAGTGVVLGRRRRQTHPPRRFLCLDCSSRFTRRLRRSG